MEWLIKFLSVIICVWIIVQAAAEAPNRRLLLFSALIKTDQSWSLQLLYKDSSIQTIVQLQYIKCLK